MAAEPGILARNRLEHTLHGADVGARRGAAGGVHEPAREIGVLHVERLLGADLAFGGAAQRARLVRRDRRPRFADHQQGGLQERDALRRSLRERGHAEHLIELFRVVLKHGYSRTIAVEPFEYQPDGLGAAAFAAGYVRGLWEGL